MRFKDLASPEFPIAEKRIDAGVTYGKKHLNHDSSDFSDGHDSGLGKKNQ
jgi:hypothetical protein